MSIAPLRVRYAGSLRARVQPEPLTTTAQAMRRTEPDPVELDETPSPPTYPRRRPISAPQLEAEWTAPAEEMIR